MNTYHSIQDDMLQLLKSNELCDTSVKTTDGETISFHSLIVNSRTKIPLSKLKDILFTKTKEEVEEILTFLYSLRTKNYERLEQFCKEIEYPELISRNKSNLYEKDFESLFKEETNKDFSIICGETEFKVHKIILFARSELFRGMFLSVQDDSGKVHDYRQSSPQAIQKLIEFFYLDQIHEQIPKEIISELEEMIDFYQLHPQTKLIYELRKKGNEK
ncbi:hypothetical protein M0811_06678 [Anaeramoeba ignava]|uniref:BTB domain-containing protein n=1 Tax=Anaeramoeba ignava TaxID=1746090 RepID=A0A9Q0LLR2_ANAIG|nr:hypothetical protein M0811_06678 [Anaeramoeba ignava]